MALQGRDLAILTARFGCARFGAFRFGFCPDDDVHGVGTDEPGEYNWKEETTDDTTAWTLGDECQGGVCGWRPVASFTADPETGDAPLTVQFTDTSTPANDIVAWSWDFGDGSSSTEQHPEHEYAADGEYTVMLTVTSGKGTSTATGTVTVSAGLFIVAGLVTVDGSTPGAEYIFRVELWERLDGATGVNPDKPAGPDFAKIDTVEVEGGEGGGAYEFTGVPEGTYAAVATSIGYPCEEDEVWTDSTYVDEDGDAFPDRDLAFTSVPV